MALICLAKLMNLGRYGYGIFFIMSRLRAQQQPAAPLYCCLRTSQQCVRVCACARARFVCEVRLENGKFKTTFTCSVYHVY